MKKINLKLTQKQLSTIKEALDMLRIDWENTCFPNNKKIMRDIESVENAILKTLKELP